MNCKRATHKADSSLVVDLDERHAAQVITQCWEATGLAQVKFAHLMGVSLRALADWRSTTKPIPAWAVRAAYFAAISAGVPVRFPQPFVTREMVEAALYRKSHV
jgi:hypothetical protein